VKKAVHSRLPCDDAVRGPDEASVAVSIGGVEHSSTIGVVVTEAFRRFKEDRYTCLAWL